LKKKGAASGEKKNDRDNDGTHKWKRAIQGSALQLQYFGLRRGATDIGIQVLAGQPRLSIETNFFEHALQMQGSGPAADAVRTSWSIERK
jgi:hypothetical protein